MPPIKVSVPFDVVIAFEIAFGVAMFLFWMGIRNQRAGWRRHRPNVVLEMLTLWAKANAELRSGTPPSPLSVKSSAEAPLIVSEQLTLLNRALSVNAGVKPLTVEP